MWHLKHPLGIHFLNTDVASWLISMLHTERFSQTPLAISKILFCNPDVMEGAEQKENKSNNKACTDARRDMEGKTNAA